MKKLHLIIAITLVSLITFTSCMQPAPEQTIKNLKEGIIGETTTSKKYAAFALKAKEEGYVSIAALFEAASKSEGIHASNHLDVLKALGVKMDEFTPTFEVKTTFENLKAAIEGESYEVSTMYPKFIKEAQVEKSSKAEKSFQWAMDTEKKHNTFYKNGILGIANNTTANLPVEYVVCPVCGNTYDKANMDNTCAFCHKSLL